MHAGWSLQGWKLFSQSSCNLQWRRLSIFSTDGIQQRAGVFKSHGSQRGWPAEPSISPETLLSIQDLRDFRFLQPYSADTSIPSESASLLTSRSCHPSCQRTAEIAARASPSSYHRTPHHSLGLHSSIHKEGVAQDLLTILGGFLRCRSSADEVDRRPRHIAVVAMLLPTEARHGSLVARQENSGNITTVTAV